MQEQQKKSQVSSLFRLEKKVTYRVFSVNSLCLVFLAWKMQYLRSNVKCWHLQLPLEYKKRDRE